MSASSSGCFALIPVRDFKTGKSRLARTLDGAGRSMLGRWMLERVLGAVGAVSLIEQIAVLSDSKEVLALAGEHGAAGLFQKSGGLNADLETGRRWAQERNARSLLIIHGDLPLLKAGEVSAFIEQAASPPDAPARRVSIARSKDGGTNALLLEPADAIPFLFGEGSFEKHRAAAIANRCEARRWEAFGLAHDIDSPANLEHLLCAEAEVPGWLASVPVR